VSSSPLHTSRVIPRNLKLGKTIEKCEEAVDMHEAQMYIKKQQITEKIRGGVSSLNWVGGSIPP